MLGLAGVLVGVLDSKLLLATARLTNEHTLCITKVLGLELELWLCLCLASMCAIYCSQRGSLTLAHTATKWKPVHLATQLQLPQRLAAIGVVALAPTFALFCTAARGCLLFSTSEQFDSKLSTAIFCICIYLGLAARKIRCAYANT